MKKIATLLMLITFGFTVVKADNFIDVYKKIYPINESEQLKVFSQNTIKGMIKTADEAIFIQQNEELKKQKKVLENLRGMYILMDITDSGTEEQAAKLKKLFSKYELLASCEMRGVNHLIYAKVKGKKIKEMVFILSDSGNSRMVFDIEFKKPVKMDSWQNDLGEISFNQYKLKDITGQKK